MILSLTILITLFASSLYAMYYLVKKGMRDANRNNLLPDVNDIDVIYTIVGKDEKQKTDKI